MLKFAPAILLFAVFVMPRVAPASDEVDYSAPYLVVENGELVTKYPAKDHEGAAVAADTQADADATSSDAPSNQMPLTVVAIAALVAFLLWARSRE